MAKIRAFLISPIVGIQLLPDLTDMQNSAKPVILSKLSEGVKLGDPPLRGGGLVSHDKWKKIYANMKPRRRMKPWVAGKVTRGKAICKSTIDDFRILEVFHLSKLYLTTPRDQAPRQKCAGVLRVCLPPHVPLFMGSGCFGACYNSLAKGFPLRGMDQRDDVRQCQTA